jgi:hypothetical protein
MFGAELYAAAKEGLTAEVSYYMTQRRGLTDLLQK